MWISVCVCACVHGIGIGWVNTGGALQAGRQAGSE